MVEGAERARRVAAILEVAGALDSGPSPTPILELALAVWERAERATREDCAGRGCMWCREQLKGAGGGRAG